MLTVIICVGIGIAIHKYKVIPKIAEIVEEMMHDNES